MRTIELNVNKVHSYNIVIDPELYDYTATKEYGKLTKFEIKTNSPVNRSFVTALKRALEKEPIVVQETPQSVIFDCTQAELNYRDGTISVFHKGVQIVESNKY